MRKPTSSLNAAAAKTREVQHTARARKSKKPRPAKDSHRKKTTAQKTNPGRPPPPGHGKRGGDGYLGYLLRQAQAATRLTLERALAEFGVTQPQFAVLTMLKAYPGLSGADLARVALLTPQTVGQIIRNLERAGAICKTPHPVHGRVLQWTLSRTGVTLLRRCRRHALALERRLAASLSPRTETAVRHWLTTVAAEMAA